MCMYVGIKFICMSVCYTHKFVCAHVGITCMNLSTYIHKLMYGGCVSIDE